MAAVCKPHDLTFFQVGLLRLTGLSGMGLVGGRLLREPLNLTLNPLWLGGLSVVDGLGLLVTEVVSTEVAIMDGSA